MPTMKPQFPFKVFPSTHNKRLSLFDSILFGGPLGFHLAYWFRISEESFFLLSEIGIAGPLMYLFPCVCVCVLRRLFLVVTTTSSTAP